AIDKIGTKADAACLASNKRSTVRPMSTPTEASKAQAANAQNIVERLICLQYVRWSRKGARRPLIYAHPTSPITSASMKAYFVTDTPTAPTNLVWSLNSHCMRLYQAPRPLIDRKIPASARTTIIATRLI